MFGGLDEKCQQLHAALGSLAERDLNKLVVHTQRSEQGHSAYFNADDGTTKAELQNAVTLLVANIGSLRDHLKKWCQAQNFPFEGDDYINANISAALVHDLWNSDKHGGLDRPPRSGKIPTIKDLRKALVMSTGTESGSSVFMTMDPRTGQMIIGGSEGSSAAHKIVATIVDENNNPLGDFETVCREAIDGWQALMVKAGVQL